MSFLINPYRFAAAGDPNFANVSLLLHGDGANGSTTIVDSSSSPKTVTAAGNAQISTAQSKFGGASILFDGSGDYATTPDNSAFAFGSGDFTIEFWLRATSTSPATYGTMVAKRASGVVFAPFVIATFSGTVVLFSSSNGSSWDITAGASFGAITNGQWHFLTLARSGSSIRGFLDGSLSFTITSSASLFANADVLTIGGDVGSNYFNGYIDDLRITKGVARYTANFTPPTAPFPDF